MQIVQVVGCFKNSNIINRKNNAANFRPEMVQHNYDTTTLFFSKQVIILLAPNSRISGNTGKA